MKIYELINKPSGTYGLNGTSITVNDLLLIENTEDISLLLIEKTFTEAQSLVSSNSLVKGAIYKISGFYKDKISSDYPLKFYNDGNNLGTTIYLTALTGNTFSREGWGEFYNPKYFSFDDYGNTDGTGLYGIWDGDNPDAGEIPDYAEDQVVFWGGYAWKNLTGDVGTAADVLNLDSTNWEKLPYSNTTYYQKVIEYIEADFTEDVVLRRVDRINNVDVLFSLRFEDNESFNFHPISVMCWGNSNSVSSRLSDIKVEKSYVEFVNFKGLDNYSNEIKNFSYIENNYFGKNSSIYLNTLINTEMYSNILLDSRIEANKLSYSGIYSNTLTNNSYIEDTILTNSQIYSNILTQSNIHYNSLINSRILNNELTESSIRYNTLTNGVIEYNILSSDSRIIYNTLSNSSTSYNTLTSSHIESNTLINFSSISNNNLTGSSIEFNTLTISSITYNTFTTSRVYYNTLLNGNSIDSNDLDNSDVFYNDLKSSTINFNILVNSYMFSNSLIQSQFDFSTSGTLTSKTISKIDVKNSIVTDDISSATIIFGDYSKQIFKRQDGTPRLGYYNNSDVFTVVDIDA